MKYIHQFNSWYDNLPGTPRFSIFMGYMAVAIFSLQIGFAIGNIALTTVGAVLFTVAALVACVRAFGMGPVHNAVGIVLLAFVVSFLGLAIAAMVLG